jgi:hypothetical protein
LELSEWLKKNQEMTKDVNAFCQIDDNPIKLGEYQAAQNSAQHPNRLVWMVGDWHSFKQKGSFKKGIV